MGEIGDLQVSDDVIAELAPTKVWSLFMVSFSAIITDYTIYNKIIIIVT